MGWGQMHQQSAEFMCFFLKCGEEYQNLCRLPGVTGIHFIIVSDAALVGLWLPDRRPVVRLIAGDTHLVTAIGVHDVNTPGTIPIGFKRDVFAIKRPVRMPADARRVVSELAPVGAIRIDHEHVVAALGDRGIGDLSPVG